MKRLLITTLLLCTLVACSPSRPVLRLYAWGQFFSPEAIAEFEDRFDCWVEIDTFDSNEALYAKLKAGATGYDLIFPSSYFVELLQKQGLILDLDLERIPNVSGLGSQLFPEAAKPSRWSIPYMISFACVGYRKDRVENPEQSWGIVLDPQFAKRVSLLNDPRETIGAALKYLGYSVNSTNPSEIHQAAEQVLVWKRNIAQFDSEHYHYGLATGERLIVHGYSGPLAQAARQDPKLGIFVPGEGTTISSDHMAIPVGAPELDLAYEFMNFLLEPKVAAMNMDVVLEVTPVPAALDFISDQTRMNPALQVKGENLQKSELIRDLGPAIKYYNMEWDYIKSSR